MILNRLAVTKLRYDVFHSRRSDFFRRIRFPRAATWRTDEGGSGDAPSRAPNGCHRAKRRLR